MSSKTPLSPLNRPRHGSRKRWILLAVGCIAVISLLVQFVSSPTHDNQLNPNKNNDLTSSTNAHHPHHNTTFQNNNFYSNLFVNCQTLPVVDPKDVGQWATVRPISPARQFEMNVHNPKEDIFVSADILSAGCFECGVWKSLLKVLFESTPDTFLLDIGANIGLYSLTAAAANRTVVAVEPFRKNYQRICNSLSRNPDFVDLQLIQAAATNQPQWLQFLRTNTTNKGSVAVIPRTTTHDEGLDASQEGWTHVRGIRLDDIAHWLPQNRSVVIKVDVEGSECHALAGAMEYLSNLKIEYAAIEWSQERLLECEERAAIFELFHQHNQLKPFLYTATGWQALDPLNWTLWKQRGPHPDTALFDMAWSKSLPKLS